jgi:hypothetical protein
MALALGSPHPVPRITARIRNRIITIRCIGILHRLNEIATNNPLISY